MQLNLIPNVFPFSLFDELSRNAVYAERGKSKRGNTKNRQKISKDARTDTLSNLTLYLPPRLDPDALRLKYQ